LKHGHGGPDGWVRVVAPCAGAWIETLSRSSPLFRPHVAPCAGAWIETRRISGNRLLNEVAPCAGAWIETSSS